MHEQIISQLKGFNCEPLVLVTDYGTKLGLKAYVTNFIESKFWHKIWYNIQSLFKV